MQPHLASLVCCSETTQSCRRAQLFCKIYLCLLAKKLTYGIISGKGGDLLYPFLRDLLSDKKGGTVFTCFGPWHWCYILLVAAAITATWRFLKNRSQNIRRKTVEFFLSAAFGLYIADFFLMPFAYGSIDIEKLPFHICTAMCVACFVSRYTPRLGKYRLHFTLLGFLSNLVYLIYPAGVMWHQAHPLSYRAIQTLLFHGTMTIYGFLTLVFDEAGLQWGQFRRDLTVIAGMTLWAVFGNALYTENLPGYNWFFLLQDPFYILPSHIAPFVMPILNVVLFFAAELLLYVLFGVLRKKLHPIPNSEGREIRG